MCLHVWAAGDYMYMSVLPPGTAAGQIHPQKKQHSLVVFVSFLVVLWPGGKTDMHMIPSSPCLLAYQLSHLHSESPFMGLNLFEKSVLD